MAYIYEINGQRVEFEREPTEADIDEAARSLGGGTDAGMPNMAPQAVNATKQLAAVAPEAISQGVSAAKQFVMSRPAMQTAADIAGIVSHGVPVGSMVKGALSANAGTIGDVATNAANMVRQGAGAIGAGARGVGSALVTGAVAPESAFLMPYQMAAYEQDKIRANPNAAGLESNPYAQVQRGEYATTRAAGAANQRSAVRNQRYGGLTPEEQAILEKDRLNMQMRVQAAKRVLGQ